MNKPIPIQPNWMPSISLSALSPVRSNSRSYTNKVTLEFGPVSIDGPWEVSWIDVKLPSGVILQVPLQAARRLHRGDYLTVFPYELKLRLPSTK